MAIADPWDEPTMTGRGYERLLGTELRRIGAVVHDTTAALGVLERGVGDFVLDVGAGVRVVVEAKNRPLNRAESMAELDAAMANRAACAGVLVFAHPHQCGGKRLRVCSGNRITAVWQPGQEDDGALDAALELARCLAARTHEQAIIAKRMRRLDHIVCQPTVSRADARAVIADVTARLAT